MVRIKNLPKKSPEPGTSVHNIESELIVHCAATFYQKMAVGKCHACGLKMNGLEERRPGIKCKQCKLEHCFKCAEITVEVCDAVRGMKKGFWTCNECETKSVDMKAVLESMKSIKTELSTIQQGQADQQSEREQVLESLKVVKAVAEKLDRIETVQESHENRLSSHDEEIKKNTKKREEEEERINRLEERMEKIDQNAMSMRQCNTVAREVREMEKREKRIVFFNVPESTEKEEEDKIKRDVQKVEEVLKELNFEGGPPKHLGRIGKTGMRYPRQILVSFQTAEECEGVVRKCRDGPKLTGDIFINHDRTFNQRQEAKLFRMEREEEEKDGDVSQSARNGAKPRGRPRGRGGAGRGGGGRGGVGGGRGGSRGGRGGKNGGNDRKKRPISSDDDNDEAKRHKVADNANLPQSQRTPEQTRTKPVSEHPATPHASTHSGLGAVGGVGESF